jgi:iron complex outermembrane receptor protein
MVDAPEGTEPRHETLYNLEFGIRQRGLNYYTEVTLYHMNYRNELVLTGELNGVGTPIRKNIGSSYRMGCEFVAGYSAWSKLNITGNITLSKNKTDYTENVNDSEFVTYNDVDISFSPGIISGGSITYKLLKNLSTRIVFKHVGKQYLDNTGSEARKLDPYTVTDILVHYSVPVKKIKKIDFSVRINNIFNLEHNSNGSLWDGIPQYYPQAGINYLAGVNVRL